jgi:4-hydroxy-tetrahydrodipicolinate synthase
MSDAMTAMLDHGIFAAALTPIGRDLAPDHAAFLEHCRWLLANGCDGLGILGTTGEANSLSLDQRLALIETATANLPPHRLLPGTGACAVADVVRLSRACLSGGAFSVLVLPPFYYKPITDDGVFTFFAQAIETIADDRLRLYLYNFPRMTTYAFSPEVIERLMKRFGPIIAGIKDSAGDWESMRSMQRRFPTLRVFAGTEVHLLALLREGGAGCISATANVTSALCQKLLAAWRAKDAGADALQARLTELRQALQAYPAIPALKRLTERRTGNSAWRAVLPPFQAMSDEVFAPLAADLKRLGAGE